MQGYGDWVVSVSQFLLAAFSALFSSFCCLFFSLWLPYLLIFIPAKHFYVLAL